MKNIVVKSLSLKLEWTVHCQGSLYLFEIVREYYAGEMDH